MQLCVTVPDYDLALKYYKELRDLGYIGQETIYKAVNKTTGELKLLKVNRCATSQLNQNRTIHLQRRKQNQV